MGLLDTIRSALGFRPPLPTRDPNAPLSFTEPARARLRELPAGHGIHVWTTELDRGRLVQVEEGPSQGPPPPGLDDLPVTASDPDLARLRGRTLDHRDGRWVVDVHLELRARETPNPDSRLYLTDQVFGAGRPAFFVPGPELPDLAARLLAVPGVRSVLVRETTVTIEREPGSAWPAIDRGVDVALREHLTLLGAPLSGAEGGAARDPLEDEIRAVLEQRVIPAIHRDGGDLELLGYSNGVVKVSMVGACRTCPSSTATLHHGIERTLKEAFPGRIERVEQV